MRGLAAGGWVEGEEKELEGKNLLVKGADLG